MGVCSHIEYEAQAAIEMEALLQRDFRSATPFQFNVTLQNNGCLEIDYCPLVYELVPLLSSQDADISELSRRFHSTIVSMICEICSRLAAQFGTNQIVMSGGVFCNEFVLVNAMTALETRGFKPFCHQLVPTNDGGISLGQVVVAAHAGGARNS